MKLCRQFASAFIVLFGLLASAKPAAAEPELVFDGGTGLFKIRYHTVDLVSSAFVFWHDNWQWSAVKVKGESLGGGQYSIKGISKKTGLSLSGKVVQTAPNELTWTIAVTRTGESRVEEWGGISFKASAIPGMPHEAPRLLPDNEGWELQLEPDKPPLQIRFDPPLARVHFERGKAREIRAYFNQPKELLTSAKFAMKVTLPPGGVVKPSADERVAKPDPSTWYPNLTHLTRSPVDLSFLNEEELPAGKRGFLGVRDGELTFEDGHKVRFWGTNLTAAALFRTNPRNVRAQARRLSQLGFNLVRIHHHDSSWVKPNIFGNRSSDTRSLDPQSLRKIDWWIKCLKDEGIYIWLDLDVGRSFTTADDIDTFAEIAKGKPTATGKGFSYINESIKARMKEFAKSYLTHANLYTGLSYKDDPAVAFVLITNENDLTHHFGNALLPDKKVPKHNAIYMQEAESFAERQDLDPKRTWRSWEHGPSKIFLNDIEHRFNVEMMTYMRKLGVRVPIATTNSWGGMTLAGLPSLTDGDIVDVHSYGKPDFLQSDPRYKPNLVSWIAAAGILGKPVTVTEWNVSPFPAQSRSSIAPYVAAIASFQGWDALMGYAYSQSSLDRPTPPSNWDMSNDPTMLASMPMAALLYRQGHVGEGIETVIFAPSAEALISTPLSPRTSRAVRTLTERHRMRIVLPRMGELPWFLPRKIKDGAKVVENTHADFSEGHGSLVCSDSKEVCRDWQQGILTVQTPSTQLVGGWIGGKKIALKNTTFSIDTANSVVAVQSLDQRPIGESERILISMAAQTVRHPLGGKDTLSEPVSGRLSIHAKPGLNARRLMPDGSRQTLPVDFAGGTYTIRLDPSLGTYWLLLSK